MATTAAPGLPEIERARERLDGIARVTPVYPSETFSRLAGRPVSLKAENLQRTGSFKIRGAYVRIANLSAAERANGVVAASAGNHAQGVALAAARHGIKAVVCMAENATPAKIAATKGYGAEVVLHGMIWDEANEKAKELVRDQGLTYVHPFDDEQLIAGQGTLGLEIVQDWPEVDAVVVPIGGGGLISGVSMAVKSHNPKARLIGVESSDGPAMKMSVESGRLETIDCRTIIDGLRVRRVGEINLSVVQRFVDEIVALPDRDIFDAVVWVMERCKLVAEGAAAAPVAALLHGLIKLPAGSRVAVVLSGGNVNLDQLRGLKWN
jgi:threonine dehydratase